MFKSIKKFFGRGSSTKGFGWEAGAKWYNGPTRGTKEILLSTNSSPWMFAVLFRLANEIAHLPWLATEPGAVKMSRSKLLREVSKGISEQKFSAATDREEMVEVDHPLIDLINRPNPKQTKWEFFFASVFCLAGPGEVFWLIERGSNTGQPVELWPVPPHWVKSTPTKENPHFMLHDDVNIGRKKIPEEDMIWIKIPQAANPIHGRGAGPGRALGHEIDIDENISDHILGFFVRSAIPDMIVGMKDAMEEDVVAAKENYMRVNRGSHNSHNVFFTSGDVAVQQLNPSFRDLQMVDLRKHLRDTIIQLFGMPPEQLGIIENSNRSTIDAADYLYAKRTIQPYIDIFLSAFQERLLPQFKKAKRTVITYISPVPEDEDRVIQLMELAPDVFLVDEIRAQAGKPPLPDDQGKILYVPITYSSDLEDDEEGNNEDGKDDSTPASDDEEKVFSYANKVLNG